MKGRGKWRKILNLSGAVKESDCDSKPVQLYKKGSRISADNIKRNGIRAGTFQ